MNIYNCRRPVNADDESGMSWSASTYASGVAHDWDPEWTSASLWYHLLPFFLIVFLHFSAVSVTLIVLAALNCLY